MIAPDSLVRCNWYDDGRRRCTLGVAHLGTHAPEVTETTASASKGDELADWWRARAESEIEQTVAKATEYSGLSGGLPADLVDLGRQIAFVQRRERTFTDAELAEIGVWSYLQGKLNRWSSALRNGRMVSDDTIFDISVYTRMAAYIREKKQWP